MTTKPHDRRVAETALTIAETFPNLELDGHRFSSADYIALAQIAVEAPALIQRIR